MKLLLIVKIHTYVWFCFLIGTSNNNTQKVIIISIVNNTRKVIIISTIVSGIVLALVIAITTCLFWRSRQRQRYLLLQLHESK
jgi:H+/Cl- antiporter ClcA